jgi:hypothetical protein
VPDPGKLRVIFSQALSGPGFANTLVAALLSSTVAFAVYFPIAGSTFLGIYTLPPFKRAFRTLALGLG